MNYINNCLYAVIPLVICCYYIKANVNRPILFRIAWSFMLCILPFITSTQYCLSLLLLYWVFTWIIFELLRGTPFFKRISLSFMLVFLFSFFWEAPIHLADLISNGVTLRFLLQSIRLFPLYYVHVNFVAPSLQKLTISLLTNQIITMTLLNLQIYHILNSYGVYAIRILNYILYLYIFFSNKILVKRHEQ